jgi:hypothetical protein
VYFSAIATGPVKFDKAVFISRGCFGVSIKQEPSPGSMPHPSFVGFNLTVPFDNFSRQHMLLHRGVGNDGACC